MANSVLNVRRISFILNFFGRKSFPLVVVILLTTFSFCRAQVPRDTLYRLPYNSFYIELFGNSFIAGSLNYERIILHKAKVYIGARSGAGYGYLAGRNIFSAPLLLDFIYNIQRDLFLELDAGTTYFMEWFPFKPSELESIGPAITGFGGIRIQSPTGFTFRVGITPFYGFTDENPLFVKYKIIPWVGFSFGYSVGSHNSR